MRRFEDSNPAVLFLYFMGTAGIAMFLLNPVITACALLGGLFYLLQSTRGNGRYAWMLALWLATALLNPLFYHKGVTVLLFLNNNPITFEALAYGMVTATMVVAVLCWFRSFSRIMTSDKVMYLIGRISSRAALAVSMAVRFVPLFSKQSRRVRDAQKVMGIPRKDSPLATFQSGVRVTSVMTGWALENGITTADSMDARGYGTGKRTSYSLYRFRKSDAILSIVILCAVTLTIVNAADVKFRFYPALGEIPHTWRAWISYGAYALLTLFPTVYETAAKLAVKRRLRNCGIVGQPFGNESCSTYGRI